MKILMFVDGLAIGGKERRLVELVKGLIKYKNIKCYLAVMGNDIHFREIEDNLPVYYLLRETKKDFKIFLELYKLCKILKPDIIHCWDSMTAVYSVPVTKMIKIKFVNAMITDAPAKLKLLSKNWPRAKMTFPWSDIIIANSKAGLESYHPPSRKSYCIHNGFDFNRTENLTDTTSLRRKYRIETPKVIGMVASFTGSKDYETYLKAANIILRRRNDVTFLAIGDGPNFLLCQTMVQADLLERMKFLGKLQNVEPVMNLFDVGILTTYTEGISNVIMEYMALRKPTIVTNCKGNSELVVDKETGFLINLEATEQLTYYIELLLNDEELALAMGKKGFDRIKREFNIEKMVESHVSLYNTLVGSDK